MKYILLPLLLSLFACDSKRYDEKQIVCHFEIKQPYFLIQFDDGSYSILFKGMYTNWYKVDPETGHDFTFVSNQAKHFSDSCEAKQSLVDFLFNQGKLEYHIVK